MSLLSGVNSLLGSHLIGPTSGDLLSSSSVDGALSGPPLLDGFLRVLSGPSFGDQSHTALPVDLLSFTDANHTTAPVSILIGNQHSSLIDADLLSGSFGQNSAIDFNLGPDWALPNLVGVDLFRDDGAGTSVSVLGHKVLDLTPIADATGLGPVVNGVLDAASGPAHAVEGIVGNLTHGLGGALSLGGLLGGVTGGATGGLDLGGLLGGLTGGASGGATGGLDLGGLLGGITGGVSGGAHGGIDLGGLLGGLGLGDILGGTEGGASAGLDLGGLLGHHGLLG